MYNPSLREEPRDQLAQVIPIQHETSLLDWLESSNRLLAREVIDDRNSLENEEEITELMGVEENDYDDDDDDDVAIEE
ncbi:MULTISPECIES: DUF3134 domain-containing protein [unclassified Coleofasciculus]|uniref:DUF3134 domain-containing protein n=1 Tax=unclassified Coleofasciculus TaxID=2692782 RepID=UPI00187E57F0|nr:MULTISPECIES: DUF3134 domain-containing protein [unclassified Coleofasciculus]MBE9128169.1 DUF3134 domain-containing protein [Coleofasciculus sp. LEGE 07081]MBE9149730.1 DUF3134 domain-containing protein [Coleofasciculus sp. LEGE 07092]